MSFPRESDPGVSLSIVTPADNVKIKPFRSLYIGATGDVSIIAKDDIAAVTFVGVPAGTILPVSGDVVMLTGTTAISIVAIH